MKTIAIIVLILLIGLTSSSWAETEDSLAFLSTTPEQCNQLRESGASDEFLAQRGCCSWHKGVCGCSGGRVTCCDGSLSPSCTCHKEDTQGIIL